MFNTWPKKDCNGVNEHIYAPALKVAINFRYAVILGFVALMVLVIGMPFNGSVRVSFFPGIIGDVVSADIRMQKDAAFGQTHNNLLILERTAREADQQLQKKYELNESAIASLQVTASEDLSGTVRIELVKNAAYHVDELEKKLASASWQS